MSKSSLSAQQERFVTDLAALLVPWGMQPSLAKLYAYLLLSPEPASLDAIAETLGMAKSSASVAARVLEHYGLARRHAERGSKRIRYGASDTYSGFIVAQAALMGDIGRLIKARAPAVAEGRTLQRLRFLGSFLRKMEATIAGRVGELSDEYAGTGEFVEAK